MNLSKCSTFFKFKFTYVAVYHKYDSKDFTQKEKPVNQTIKRRNAVSNMKHRNRLNVTEYYVSELFLHYKPEMFYETPVPSQAYLLSSGDRKMN